MTLKELHDWRSLEKTRASKNTIDIVRNCIAYGFLQGRGPVIIRTLFVRHVGQLLRLLLMNAHPTEQVTALLLYIEKFAASFLCLKGQLSLSFSEFLQFWDFTLRQRPLPHTSFTLSVPLSQLSTHTTVI
jgi:hypothetical protein